MSFTTEEFNIICMQFAINSGMFAVSEQPANSYMLKYPLIRESWLHYVGCLDAFSCVALFLSM